ncbi:twin-arginine translocation signal domain-containing protein [Candidatus Pacearchaeota archaeon]|nr:twin-arginine translocation signal domain-containing protein [Candidatus Pacearchaeota archaeon]
MADYKDLSRRNFLKSVGLAGAAALGLESCVTGNCSNYSSKRQIDHYFHEFVDALGPQWDSLPLEKKRETKRLWYENNEEEITEENKKTTERFIDIYRHPDKYYNELDNDNKEWVDFILKNQESGIYYGEEKGHEVIFKILKDSPWIDAKKLTKSDIIFLEEIEAMIAYSSFR